jgi:hypothetical protein
MQGYHPANGRHLVRLLLVASTAYACTTWQVQSASPERVLSEHQPDKIRVTRPNRNDIVLRGPQIVGDSLYGSRDASHLQLGGGGYQRTSAAGAREAMALGDVGYVAIRKTDPLATSALVAMGAGIGALMIGIASMGEE